MQAYKDRSYLAKAWAQAAEGQPAGLTVKPAAALGLALCLFVAVSVVVEEWEVPAMTLAVPARFYRSESRDPWATLLVDPSLQVPSALAEQAERAVAAETVWQGFVVGTVAQAALRACLAFAGF